MDRFLNMFSDDDLGRLTKAPKPKFKVQPITKKTADVSGIVEEDHAKYHIKAGRLGGIYVARAFPKQSAQAQGVIAEAKGESEADAIAALMEIIEARDVQRTADRRWDEASGLSIPTEMEFLEALRQARLSKAQVAMLKALAIATDEGLTFGQLASAAGYKSKDTGAKVFRKVGELIADYLGLEPPEDDARSPGGPIRLLAFGQGGADDDLPTVCIMHAELRGAVRAAL